MSQEIMFQDDPDVNPINQGHNFIDEVKVMREELRRLQPEPLARQFAKVEKKIEDMNVNLTKKIEDMNVNFTNIIMELRTTMINNHRETITRQSANETNTQARILNSSIQGEDTKLYPLVTMNNELIVPFPQTRDSLQQLRTMPAAMEILLRNLGVDNIPHAVKQQFNLIKTKIGIAIRY